MYNNQIKTGHFAMLQMFVTYVQWPNIVKCPILIWSLYICNTHLDHRKVSCFNLVIVHKCELHMYNDQIKTGHFAILQMCVRYVQ
jgi:hypothetical protein